MPPASIVIPTRARLPYLEVALTSLAPAALRFGAEVLVVDDGGHSSEAQALVERHGARYLPHARPLGLNIARNSGVAHSSSPLVAFLDDDVRVSEGWLAALLGAAVAHPEVEVFTGPIRVRLEGPAPRSCGGEPPPITSLDLGSADRDTRFAWGANMAIRRTALERVGPFDTTLCEGGDEQEWQERLRAERPSARVLYVADAAVEHRRVGADARLRALCRGAYARGAAARRFDLRRGSAPGRLRELVTLLGCLGHVLRRRCPAGLTMVAHSAGRLRESLRGGHPAAQEDFLSGHSGTVAGVDGLRRAVTDEAVDVWELAGGGRRRLARAASAAPPRRVVLALSIVRPEHAESAAAIAAELARSRHDVQLHTTPALAAGKFENLNLLLADHPPEGSDWLLVIDDDVELPRGFLDRFLFVCERFSLALAQPAHRLDSHAAWDVTRRRAGSVARETAFVEIGPVSAFAPVTFSSLLPFPQLRMGWGLDLHWAALAREHGWRCGIVDATAIRHRSAPAATAYPREHAIAEAREFLAARPYLPAAEAERTLVTHRRW